MLKKLLAVTLLLALVLTGCSGSPPETLSAADPVPGGQSEGAQLPDDTPRHPGMAPNEDTDYTPWTTVGLFTPPGPRETTERTSYTIAEGTEWQAEVIVLTAAEPGPTLYIIASVHGNEVAAYQAADRMKDMELKAGTLHILSPANVLGKENYSRYVKDQQDLNRSFPGDPDGTEAQQLAHAIFEDVRRVNPEFLFDLHEAITSESNRDFLGSSLIYTNLDKMNAMFLDLYLATQNGELCSEPFNFFGPGPIGSVNNVITSELDIPVITVETYRVYALERRIEDQMAVVGYVLRYFGLID